MTVIRTPDEMRAWSFRQRAAGRSVGLVPTMGALHAGHLSLVRGSAEREDHTVVSIFVNPAQFAPHEDYDRYPRAFEEDCAKAAEAGAEVIYAPDAATMYPPGYASYVEVERLQDGLCGVTRPHFFRGVATVVTKLFNAVQPDRAYFGLKDGQQTTILKRMVRDLDFGVEIVALPTVREADGLAMSSRNTYLSAEERERALSLSRALFHAEQLLARGARDAGALVQEVRDRMRDVEIDYVSVVDGDTLEPVDTVRGPVMVAVAAQVGATRLIDNIRFDPKTEASSTLAGVSAK